MNAVKFLERELAKAKDEKARAIDFPQTQEAWRVHLEIISELLRRAREEEAASVKS